MQQVSCPGPSCRGLPLRLAAKSVTWGVPGRYIHARRRTVHGREARGTSSANCSTDTGSAVMRAFVPTTVRKPEARRRICSVNFRQDSRSARRAVAFVRAIERGTFAGAASDLELSPSAVSKAIRRLEARLRRAARQSDDAQAFAHGRGALLFHSGRRLIEAVDGLEQEVAGLGEPSARPSAHHMHPVSRHPAPGAGADRVRPAALPRRAPCTCPWAGPGACRISAEQMDVCRCAWSRSSDSEPDGAQ